jgi:hypothetical protein
MVTRESFVLAQDRLNDARRALQRATDDLSVDQGTGPYADDPGATVAACHEAIEHAAASVFLLHELSVPERVDPGTAAGERLLETVTESFPERFDGDRTARLLLLPGVWRDAVAAAEVGVTAGERAVEPAALFTATDAETALDHATEAKRLATRHMDQGGRVAFGE